MLYIFLIVANMAVFNAECRVACVHKGFEDGYYKNKKCLCIVYQDYDMATQNYKPNRVNSDKEPTSYEED